MTVTSLNAFQAVTRFETDICVVGSGPAGWSISEELRDCGLRILVLESGGYPETGSHQALNAFESVGADIINGRHRTLGGTPQSPNWGGRCVMLDAVDFEARPWAPASGWPFEAAELAPFARRAAQHLGAASYDGLGNGPLPEGAAPRPALDPNKLTNVCWHHSRGEKWRTMKFQDRFLGREASNVDVLVEATVTQLTLGASGQAITSVEVADALGRRHLVIPKITVLCAGGVENARILLYSNRQQSSGVGNQHDVVGRYLMDHPINHDMILDFDPAQAAAIWGVFGPERYTSRGERRMFVHGLALSRTLQQREGLLNCAAWPKELNSVRDPVDAAKRLLKGDDSNRLGDLGLMLAQPRMMFHAAAAALSDHSVRHRVERIGFVATSEQTPDRDSRVTLSDRTDWLGLPTTRIDWRIHPVEIASQIRLAEIIRSEFERLGLPRATMRTENLQAGFIDHCHPTGTTRMASNPKLGVVDAQCRVHGVDNLYILGSSVFPTGGHANPTLTIAALATRLGDHLKGTALRWNPVRALATVSLASRTAAA